MDDAPAPAPPAFGNADHGVRGRFPTHDILGVRVSACSEDEALTHLMDRLARRYKTPTAYANANLLTVLSRHPRGPELLDEFFVINDGVGLDIAAKSLYGEPFPANLNGTDFNPALLHAAPSGTRVFLYGAKPDVVEACAEILPARYDVDVCGHQHGYAQDADAVISAINQARAEIVLVAMGNPRQEIWIADHKDRVHAPILVGVGAFFDFTAGKFPRAPGWMRALRLEFVYRLSREPRRLAKRYTVDVAEFLWKVRAQKRRQAR